MRSWKHSGFSVDRSVRIQGSDRQAVDRITQYMVRCPFSLERIVRVTPEGNVEKILRHCGLWTDPPPSRASPSILYTPPVQLDLLYVAEDAEPYDDARYDASG